MTKGLIRLNGPVRRRPGRPTKAEQFADQLLQEGAKFTLPPEKPELAQRVLTISEMITGRLVRELRRHVYVLGPYGVLGGETNSAICGAIRCLAYHVFTQRRHAYRECLPLLTPALEEYAQTLGSRVNAYPVPHPSLSPQVAFSSAQSKRDVWEAMWGEHDYGHNRRQLLQWLIARFPLY